MECIFVASVEGEATEDEATADEATEDEATADEATVSEATVSEATAGEAADIASLTGYAKAKAIAAAIAGGADFEETMKAYTEDGSTEEQMLRGYPVAENSTTYGEAFMAGAMALEHVGDVSDVIVTDYGYFILRYAKDLESGEADFEARKETETEETLTNKKNDAYSAFIDNILDEADIQVGDLSQMYHVYVGEAVEATVAYASVNADAKLLDMPGGDAVADMKAGASVDILGSIDADGKTYSFVAVPGTEIKGYVGTDMLDEMAEDAALAVDNTALVTRVEQIDKNPTFTIAMNDGSLIYGELYPEKAPESVGNFVSLANGSFYDGLPPRDLRLYDSGRRSERRRHRRPGLRHPRRVQQQRRGERPEPRARRAEHGAFQRERFRRKPVLHHACGQRLSGWQLRRVRHGARRSGYRGRHRLRADRQQR